MCCFMQPYYSGFMMPNMMCGMPMMMPYNHRHCGPSNFGEGFGAGFGMSLGFGLGRMLNCWF